MRGIKLRILVIHYGSPSEQARESVPMSIEVGGQIAPFSFKLKSYMSASMLARP
jgi:hypothetical protein